MHTVLLETNEGADFQLYRRPGIVRGDDGKLVAYYEGLKTEGNKRQTLLCRISRDNGQNWSERIVIASGGATGMLHNIMMACANGVYHCLWNVQYRQLLYSSSVDGEYWSAPKDLTRQLWRADCEYPWNAFGIGSGHAVTLQSGRILVPTWFTTGGDSHKPSGFGNIYSDDGFQTVYIGSVIASGTGIKNPNEGAIAELNDGIVIATVRHDNETRARAFTLGDGIHRWQPVCYREDLPDPICHAALLNTPYGLLFSNCANSDPGWKAGYERREFRYPWSNDARKNLTVRLSADGGKSFSRRLTIAEKGGYSDLACAGDQIICIYETGWNACETCIFPHQIGVAAFPVDEMENG